MVVACMVYRMNGSDPSVVNLGETGHMACTIPASACSDLADICGLQYAAARSAPHTAFLRGKPCAVTTITLACGDGSNAAWIGGGVGMAKVGRMAIPS